MVQNNTQSEILVSLLLLVGLLLNCIESEPNYRLEISLSLSLDRGSQAKCLLDCQNEASGLYSPRLVSCKRRQGRCKRCPEKPSALRTRQGNCV